MQNLRYPNMEMESEKTEVKRWLQNDFYLIKREHKG